MVWIAGSIVWFDYLEPGICSASERITSSEVALAFGIEQFRKDTDLMRRLNIDNTEVERLLQEKGCCSAAKGDWTKDRSKWNVRVTGQALNGNYLDYNIFFSECGKGLYTHVQKGAAP